MHTGLIRNTAGEGAMSAMSRIYGNIGFKGLWNGLSVRVGLITVAGSPLITLTED